MKTETIEVPHFDGYKCIGYRIPNIGECYLVEDELQECQFPHSAPLLIYEKLTLKRYVFEETKEFRRLRSGDMYLSTAGEVILWREDEPSLGSYTILRKVDE